MSFLSKLQLVGNKVGQQATALGKDLAQQVEQRGNTTMGSFKLENECTKAAKILTTFLADPLHPESALNAIPKSVLSSAQGFAIFTVLKAGFIWSGKMGTGVVIARNMEDGSWSAPSCIGTGGVGVGFQIGADISEFVVVLNSAEAVRTFAKGGNVTIGGKASATAGPIGIGAGVDTALINPAPMFTYSKSRGLFAGVSLEGTVLIERKDANEAFYGQQISALDILTGKIPPPEAASALYEAIESAEDVNEAGLNPADNGGYAVPPSASTVQPQGEDGHFFDAGAAHKE